MPGVMRFKPHCKVRGVANIEVGVRGSVPQDVDIMEVRCWHGGSIVDVVGNASRKNEINFAIDPICWHRLWYATLRLRPAYAETGGAARLRPLARSTPRLGFYRYGLKDHSAYACGSHSGLPGRRKTAYQVT